LSILDVSVGTESLIISDYKRDKIYKMSQYSYIYSIIYGISVNYHN